VGGGAPPWSGDRGPAPPPAPHDDCRADQRGTPVVLVHGTFATHQEFFKLAPRLEAEGYCTYALNYGCTSGNSSCGRGPIEASARERGDEGNDRFFGEGGPDAINSTDGVRGNDSVNGGGGQDACNGDFGDGRSNCP
jgi:hypothetical protein